METSFLILCSLAVTASSALAQSALLVGRDRASVIERGPHHALWYWTTEQVWPDGQKRMEEHSVVELATGLNFQKDGQWIPAAEIIELFPDGAVARQAQHQVIWAPNVNSDGALDLLMPDGQRLRSHVVGIAYTDAATGKSMLIAEPKDSIGEVGGNQVIYRDAFNGPFRADVRYTHTRAGVEQDVVLHQKPPPPGDYGLNPATTRLEVWSEFLAPPAPTIKQQVLRQETDPQVRRTMAMPDLVDQTLNFGSMQIGSGQAFSIDGPDASAVPVAKSWVQLNGQQFLIEAVEFPTIAPLLQVLQQAAAPARQENAQLKQPVKNRQEMARALRRVPAPDKKKNKTMRMASAPLSGPMVVLDYTTLNSSQTNYTFKADFTYYISAPVNIYATNHMEGGTVIKFAKGASATISVKGKLIGDTDMYRPAVLTASDDGTVGEPVTFNTLSGSYATTALDFDYVTSGTVASVQNVRILYALTGVHFNGGTTNELRHLQLVNCGAGVKADNAKYAVRNVLGWNLTNALTGSSSTGAWEHATLDGVTNLVSSVTGQFTNCLLTAVVSTNGLAGLSNIVLSSSSGVYKVVGGGSHYLTNSSQYRDLGSTNINPTLAKELKLRTNYEPIVLGDVNANTTLSPQASRDSNLPDPGFHYAPLDYWVSGVNVASNVTVSISAGTALGLDLATNSWGFILKNAKLISTGDALNLNYAVRAHTAQEKSGGNLTTRACFYDGNSSSGSRECELRLRFTETDQLANDGYMVYVGTKFGALEWTHGRVFNPTLVLDTSASGTLVCGLTNTLWERGGVEFGLGTSGSGVTVHMRNNLARNLQSWHFFAGTTNWTVRDNLFESVSVLTNNGSVVQNSYNAYFNTAYGLTSGTNNTNLTSLTYQTGPLGKYYQPTNSVLINAGSLTNAALAGLYAFTTTTNQVNEINSQVDIGIHYVAVNSSGQPIDTDADGIPDYQEDANGNGVVDSGETDWKNAGDWGLKVLITRPKNGSNLP